MDDIDTQGKKPKKASNKEVMMIVIVVVLAFGLTVAGIVYLTNFLIGDKPAETQLSQVDTLAVPQAPEDGEVVRFTMEDNATTTDGDIPTPPIVDAPIVTTPPAATATPPAVTPPATTPPPAATPPAVATTPPATTPPAATRTPATTPTQVASIPANVPRVAPTRGSYQLQLSAFKSEERALAEAKRYILDYPDIYIMRADLGGEGVWFRVRCCSAGTQDELASIKADLERKYKITPYVVKVQ